MAEKNMREYGTGSVSQRKDGKWTARIRIGYMPNGNPRIKAFYGKTENEVKRKMREFIRDFHRNDGVVVQRSTVQNFMETWLYETKRNDLKPKSFDRLEQTLKYQVFPNIGHIQLAAVQPSDIQRLLNKLADEGKSASTIKKTYDAINACFKNGVIQRTINYNPALGVTVPKGKAPRKGELKYFSDDEARAICEAATRRLKNGKKMYRLGEIFIVILDTGIRLGEANGLRWDHVSFDKREIFIDSTIEMVRDRSDTTKATFVKYEQNSTKSESSKRYVPLNDEALDALKKLHEITGDCEYVMTTSRGNIMLPRQIDRMFRKVEATAKIPEDRIFGVHALRHTFATRLFKAGVDVKIVSELLGHSDITITYNTYIHVIDDQKRAAAALAVVQTDQ